MTFVPFANSYMVTNRQPVSGHDFNGQPDCPGTLHYVTAPERYETNASNYVNQETTSGNTQALPPDFSRKLLKDLALTAAYGQSPKLTVLIHGLGNVWSDVVLETAGLGQRLSETGKNQPDFGGLVIGFSWPSFGVVFSVAEYPIIREHIFESRKSFANFFTALQALRTACPGLELNLICHSEGNYMCQVGMTELYNAKPQKYIDQTLLAAADLQTITFNRHSIFGGGSLPIRQASDRVTFYYSDHDDVLLGAEALPREEVDAFRLGRSGPTDGLFFRSSYELVFPGVFGVNCSEVAQDDNLHGAPLVHSSYLYIPQILLDMTQTMAGKAEGAVSNRKGIVGSNEQGWDMQRVAQ